MANQTEEKHRPWDFSNTFIHAWAQHKDGDGIVWIEMWKPLSDLPAAG